MNSVTLVGNLTDDVELRYTQSGRAVGSFTVAVSHKQRHNGRVQDVTDGFFRCVAWRDLAEHVGDSLNKGTRVLVVGKLSQRNWQDDDGRRRSSIEINVSHVGPELSFAVARVGGGQTNETK